MSNPSVTRPHAARRLGSDSRRGLDSTKDLIRSAGFGEFVREVAEDLGYELRVTTRRNDVRDKKFRFHA